MRPRWTETTKRMVVVIGVALGLLLLYLARSTLTSLLLAAVVAYALYPLIEWLQKHLRFPHTLATIVVFVLLLMLLATIPILVVPVIAGQVRTLNLNLMTLFSQGREWLRATLLAWRTVPIAGGTLDLSSLVDPALTALGESGAMPVLPSPSTWLPGVFGTLSGFASTVTSATLVFFLTFLYSFYLVSDIDRWKAQVRKMIPDAYRGELWKLEHNLTKIWGSFFRGQLLLCLIVAVATFLVLTALGIPGSVPLALLVGVLNVIPNLGPLIAGIPVVVVSLIQGSSTIPLPNGWVTLIVLGAYILVHVLAGNVLAPIIIGGSVDLPPLVMLVGVVIGASVAGLVGAFLATPLLATLRVLAAYAYNKILDRDPFPENVPKEEPAAPPAPAGPPVKGTPQAPAAGGDA
jgi:predicted PurR-regulated permease PerM